MVKRLLPLVTLAAVASLALVTCGGGGAEPAAPQRSSPPPPPAAAPAAPAPAAPAQSSQPSSGGGTEFTVNLQDPGGAGEFEFDPSELTFSAGQTVSFTFSSETQFHTFTVDDLGIDVSVNGGETENLTFTFDKPGTYDLICIPHEALGMVGTITVQ